MNIWKEIMGWIVALIAALVILPLAPFVIGFALTKEERRHGHE